ncbi:MAG TPA: DUF4139 domain-containing protein [Bryobacteraceae bacterium]|jgi:hypothetical protein|nr:DUF4139 domain-containing protein [Bryobacteraceae bacterium]
MRKLLLLVQIALVVPVFAADLPIREVILYKHGVGYFERAGELHAGETARLDFKASDMNDVLKSLTVSDRNGGVIGGVRYDAAEPLENRLQDFPFTVDRQASLAAFLDQMKGARLELRLGSDTMAGTIMSSRTSKPDEKTAERETVVLLTDTGEIRTFDLGAASSVKLADPKLQGLLRDFLTVLSGARSKDRRSVYIDAPGTGTRQLAASYMTPSAVWKSSYRLIFGPQAEATLEGWAIIDNTSGDDWTNVKLSVVSGRPISFITQLYEPKYVQRPTAELAENQPVAPVVLQGAIGKGAPLNAARAFAAAPPAVREALADNLLKTESGQASSIAPATDTRDLGELFEYSFSSPVTVKQGESAMLPFLQQKIGAKKLLIYMESFGLHPMTAAEIANSTGKTLDGGPITVYDANTYAGEALVETLKAGDKRLITYGVDLGARVTTAFDSSKANVREIHFARGVLTTRNAIQETKTYTIKNVDPGRKTVIIEHKQRPGYKLLGDVKPSETTADAYRFEVNVGGNATEVFAVREERVYDQTTSISSITPDVIATYLQNKALSDAGRRQLEQIAAKKREVATNDAQLRQAQADLNSLTQDEERQRRNIESLRNVAGQQNLVQQYAGQLAAAEVKLAGLRDQQSELQRKKTTLEGELNGLIEKAEF